MKALTTPVILLSEVQYTEQAKQALQTNSSALKGRERQFLLLLMREDKLSQQACERLMDKMDLISLAAKGYIVSSQLDQSAIEKAKQQLTSYKTSPYQIESAGLVTPAENEADFAQRSAPDFNPILNLAAGNF